MSPIAARAPPADRTLGRGGSQPRDPPQAEIRLADQIRRIASSPVTFFFLHNLDLRYVFINLVGVSAGIFPLTHNAKQLADAFIHTYGFPLCNSVGGVICIQME